jgi:hypothetical protein
VWASVQECHPSGAGELNDHPDAAEDTLMRNIIRTAGWRILRLHPAFGVLLTAAAFGFVVLNTVGDDRGPVWLTTLAVVVAVFSIMATRDLVLFRRRTAGINESPQANDDLHA